jgi:menaquinone-dependent protoporphyrinogen IX oxidase
MTKLLKKVHIVEKESLIVIYRSKYGSTKQYAEWIAKELGCPLCERSTVKAAELSRYDCVVYGGGLYAGGILGVDLVRVRGTKSVCKNLALFTVGLADPATTDYSVILKKNFPQGLPLCAQVFHLRGRIDYKNISLAHRVMMAMMKKMTIGKKAYEELSDEEKLFVDTYGGKVDFVDRATIAPLVSYVRGLGRAVRVSGRQDFHEGKARDFQ